MLKECSHIIRITVVVVDVILFWAAFLLSYYLLSKYISLEPVDRYLRFFYFSTFFAVVFMFYHGIYSPLRFLRPVDVARKAALALVCVGILSAAFLFLIHATYFSRRLFGIYFVIGSILIVLEKLALCAIRTQLLEKGKGLRNVLIIGQGAKLEHLLKVIKEAPYWGLKIVDVLNFEPDVAMAVERRLQSQPIDEVYIAFSRGAGSTPDVGALLQLVESYGKIIKVFINLDEELRFSKVELFRLDSLPGLIFFSTILDPDLILLKRIMDILLSLMGLLLTALIFPVVAVAIKLDSPGPILFSQERVGLNGRRFRLYKFRSMYVDAEERKKELLAQNELKGPVFKLRDDPRITRVGQWLRITSIDEFPQFWNVLKGEMSIVGTRPPTPDEVERYQAWHYRRISIKPGITGLWQVSGRNKIKDFDEIVRLDLEYIANWSIWLDIKIIVKTAYLLLCPKKAGAC